MKSKPKILVILGPTAVGKSSIAVELALKFNGEIFSADSRQVYRGLNIGTGKITSSEMKGVKHHLLDIVDPDRRFTAMDWKIQAEEAIANIISRGKLPIICGGTGFYISTLIDNLGLPEVSADAEELKILEEKSVEELFTELQKLDPERAKTIDMKNKRRLVRAIIIARALGSVPKISLAKDSNNSLYNVFQIGLILPDPILRSRIHARLIQRIETTDENGMDMIKEAELLHSPAPTGVNLSFERMTELGLEYRYLAEFLQMKINKTELINILSTKIWQYARRQKTWWKKDARIKWFAPEDVENIEAEVKSFLSS